MNFIDFKKEFKDYLVFSLKDIKKSQAAFDRRRLSEWQEKKYLIKIRQAYYMFADTEINEPILYYIANKVYQPSYISFEMALAYYGLIPESTYGITSATTKKTSNFSTVIGYFSYRTLKSALMFGFNLQKVGNKYFKIADLEKTILDYLYINIHLTSSVDFESLRINKEELLLKINLPKIEKYLEQFDNKALTKRYREFMRFIEHA